LVVPFEPVAKGRPRFVRATGHAYTPPKTAIGEWQIRQAWLLLGDMAELTSDTPEPLLGPLRMTVQCFVTMPKSIPKYKQATARPIGYPDLDQYIKTALDALQGYAYPNDSAVVDIVASKCYGAPPRWEITIDRV
jgi:Holliday junction resolvase RusA-like endonuclease